MFFLNLLSKSAKIKEIIAEIKSKSKFCPMLSKGLISSSIYRTAKNEFIKTVSKVKITDEIVFTDGFCEGDEPEDRILFIELKADENACEIAMEFADALKKLTEAI